MESAVEIVMADVISLATIRKNHKCHETDYSPLMRSCIITIEPISVSTQLIDSCVTLIHVLHVEVNPDKTVIDDDHPGSFYNEAFIQWASCTYGESVYFIGFCLQSSNILTIFSNHIV